MKKAVTVLAILAAVVVIAYSERASIAARLMEKGLGARMGAAGIQAMPFTKPPLGELALVYGGEGLKVEALGPTWST